ncbi:multiple epidermal growth factor-like domains protein 6 [Anopheles nili]|uniref:multiple epidermal growth factor-like domains protein 6 n=1 Tax=Anopheles nili TaxID=185578 RepID=UPI00237A3D65|nr:multiple epidermal growth factor-like domains protein 6 [Anopheles nili]
MRQKQPLTTGGGPSVLLFILLLFWPSLSSSELIPFPAAGDAESVCVGVNAGIFPHPDPTLCHVYISCTFEQPIVYQCADGLVFDPLSLRCIPGDRDQCEERIEPDWQQICQGVSYAFHPHPYTCWKFVFCIFGEANKFECPAAEIWSRQHDACMLGDRDTCEVLDVANSCQGQPDGVLPHPTDCRLFLECLNGHTTVNECWRGEIFDPAQGRCVLGNTATCEPVEGLCRGVTNDLRPHPNDCHLFVFCSLGQETVLVCPPNEIFRPDIRFCVPGDRDTCEYSDVETACIGRPAGVVPHPDSCELYLSCSNDVATIQTCPAGTIFNPQTGSCAMGDRDTCLVTEGLCTMQPDGIVLEHPFQCSMFVLCQGGLAQVRPCPPGEILRVEAQFCVPGDIATCERFPVETMCQGRDGGFLLPHPVDCGAYVQCSGGIALQIDCSPGHIFIAPEQGCVPGNTQTCTPLTGVCADVPEGAILPLPDSCYYFIWCQDGRPTVNACPVGEILRPDAQFCVPGDRNTCTFEPIERMCLGQVDNTRFPHPTDCALFVTCQAEAVLVQSCPAGTIYNAPTRSCIPGLADTCEPLTNFCYGLPDAPIAHPTVCTGYINCVAGQAVFEVCSPGTVFNPELGGCVVGNTDTCVRSEGMCVGQPDGAILEHPNECDLYVVCSGGNAIAARCPAGQILDVQAMFCVPGDTNTCQFAPVETMCQSASDGAVFPYPNDCNRFVRCEGGQSTVSNCLAGHILDVATATCRPGNTDTCAFIGEVCQGRPDGWVIEHPNECGVFIWCQGGVVSVQPCPPGEILRPDAQFCVPGDSVTCIFDPVERMCDGRPDGLIYPHPTDCRQFVRCEASQPILESCRPGTIFQIATQSCVAGNGNTCSLLDDLCVGQPDSVLPHPEGCELFLMCTSGVTSALRCPEGEILHPEFLVCATGNAADCSLAPVTTEPPIISVCEGRPDGNYTHPLLCYLFIRCTSGVTEILTCPPNQIFVGAIRDCAPGNQETCIPL